VFLQPGRDRRVAHGHPWVYSNEIRMDAEAKALAPGTIAQLHRVDGKPLGVGTFNPHALIAFRQFDTDPRAIVDEAYLVQRLGQALDLRERLFDRPFYRLVHAEADRLPGLIADRFGDVIVLQANTAGMAALTPALLAAVEKVLAPAAVVFRNDHRMRALEGVESEDPDSQQVTVERVRVDEGGPVYTADVTSGQKTGWYYDQRDNRAFVARLAVGGRMLDAYCYSGGFGVAAAAKGAHQVIGIDSSEAALELARIAAVDNGVADICDFRRADVFAELEQLGGAGEKFRVVVADPPAFVKSRKDVPAGLKAYRKLARMSVALVEPGGFLFIGSCSHNVESGAFAAEVARGLTAARRTGRIVRSAGAGPDHPVHPHLPESAYLKTLLLQID
jgi:23S rRNA (cytosine1962-C5)-methyltransferase